MTTITLDEILGKIQELMDSGEGDLGRLRFILMTLRRGNPLYKSDKKYLNEKLNSTISPSTITSIIQDTPIIKRESIIDRKSVV